MHASNVLLLIAIAWLVQFALTWVQIQHYRRMMRQLVGEYQHFEGYHLFSGVARKALGSGAIVLLISDDDHVVRDCRLLAGMSVFAKFKPAESYVGMKLEDILSSSEEQLRQRRRISAKTQSIAKASKMAAENAIRSLGTKPNQVLSLAK